MTIDLFKRVALRIDLLEHGLQKDDVATIVEHLPGEDCEDGYALEVFNAVGDTICVITVPQSAVEPLTADVIPSVGRLLKQANYPVRGLRRTFETDSTQPRYFAGRYVHRS